MKIRDVRQAGIGEGAAVRDEVSGPAGALSFHDFGHRREADMRIMILSRRSTAMLP